MHRFKENIPNSSERCNMKSKFLSLFTPNSQFHFSELLYEFLCVLSEYIYTWASVCVFVCACHM